MISNDKRPSQILGNYNKLQVQNTVLSYYTSTLSTIMYQADPE